MNNELHVVFSDPLAERFAEVCKESEVTPTDVLRDFVIAVSVGEVKVGKKRKEELEKS